ncbi:MAG: GH3 auxin-responsive promoter family protein [Bacteroidota bacterium]
MALLGNLIKKGATIHAKIETRKATPYQLQQKTLHQLLKKAAKTQFGKHYNFEQILKSPSPISLFQKKIPIHDYDKMHDEWWHQSLKNIEHVAWKGKTKYYALSSGTSGNPSKYLPITPSMLRANNKVAFRVFMSLANFDLPPEIYTKEKMMLGGSTSLREMGGYFVGDLSGINISKLPAWIRQSYRPGLEIANEKDWNKKIERIAKAAPKWDIGFIMGIPSWVQLMLEKIISYHGVDHIHRIWPNLKVFIHGGVAFEPYQKGFKRLLGEELIYINTYLASEGFLGYQNRPNAGMKLVLDNGIFFEFIPFDANNFDQSNNPKPNATVLTIDNIKEGTDYAVVISTCAGAWRYLLGDTIRFTDTARSEIVITGRTKHFLNVCGEHLSVENMNCAIACLEKELDLSIREFTVSYLPDGHLFQHQWYVGCDEKIDNGVLRRALDYHLKRLNDDYATERNSLLGLEVVAIPNEVFYRWHEAKNKMGGQSKFPRVMQPRMFSEWEAFVKKFNQV